MKDKNRIFTGYQIFVTGEILVFHRCLYNKKVLPNNVVTLLIHLLLLLKLLKLGSNFHVEIKMHSLANLDYNIFCDKTPVDLYQPVLFYQFVHMFSG